ncbi:unnamed protein product [Peronospora belbahrii]|uniref:Uncharacterized protein n=1 Tax=Peronospora belbahrii TaxID=622444 RepID=A0AAU9KNN0_9STRA|nr:unnamed protein product [Peronospora belbahrii]
MGPLMCRGGCRVLEGVGWGRSCAAEAVEYWMFDAGGLDVGGFGAGGGPASLRGGIVHENQGAGKMGGWFWLGGCFYPARKGVSIEVLLVLKAEEVKYFR